MVLHEYARKVHGAFAPHAMFLFVHSMLLIVRAAFDG
jgi:hypothetical protein